MMGKRMRPDKLVMLCGLLGAMPFLGAPAVSQTGITREKPREKLSDVTSVAGCPRPADAKEVKVVDFDTGKSVAKLAVNLGSGRFKLARITVWDRPEDPRPLIPVIDAARITQGSLLFYTPNLNTDPESAHDSFILITDMGGGDVCWATPSSLINEGAYPVVSDGKPAATPVAAEAASRPRADAKPEIAPAPAPTPANPPPATRSRTRSQASP
jgi:hypothetical protein